MDKILNIVVYNFGCGGNLIRFLLSLHDNTMPVFSRSAFDKFIKQMREVEMADALVDMLEGDELANHIEYVYQTLPQTLEQRANDYSFRHLHWKFGKWFAYENMTGIPVIIAIDKFIEQTKYNTLTVVTHDISSIRNFQGLTEIKANTDIEMVSIIKEKVKKINWLGSVIAEYQEANEIFKKENNPATSIFFSPKDSGYCLTVAETIKQYQQQYNPYVINFDNFIKGDSSSFLKEYHKLLDHLNYEKSDIIDTYAIKLHADWHKERNFKIKKY